MKRVSMTSNAPRVRHERAVQFARMCRRALLAVGYRADELTLTKIPQPLREGVAVDDYDHLKPLKLTIIDQSSNGDENGLHTGKHATLPTRELSRANGVLPTSGEDSGHDTVTDDVERDLDDESRLRPLSIDCRAPFLTTSGLNGVAVVAPGQVSMCEVCGMRFAPMRCACAPYGCTNSPSVKRSVSKKRRRSSHSSVRHPRR